MPLLHGGQLFLSGLQLALSPPLRRYVLIPAGLGILMFSLAFVFVVIPLGDTAGTWLQQNMPAWLSWMNTVLMVFIYITLALAGFWLTSLLVTLIAAPFLGQLAEATWALSATPTSAQTPHPAAPTLLGSIGPSMLRELQKIRYHLPRLLGLVLLSMVPGVNVFMPLLWFGFSAWLMAAQFADYASENQAHEFRFTLQQLGYARARALGFGACTSLTLAIPFLNFLVIPAAVVGGTLLWQSIMQEQQS